MCLEGCDAGEQASEVTSVSGMTAGQGLASRQYMAGERDKAHLRDALVLVVGVDGAPGAALAGVGQARIARVVVHALLLALREPLRALVDVDALLAVGAQPQPLPVSRASGQRSHQLGCGCCGGQGHQAH